MFRKTTVPVESILYRTLPYRYVKKRKGTKEEVSGEMVYMSSLRYHTFKMSGICCVKCGIKGQYFAVEKAVENEGYHLNMYAVNDNGQEVLMTKDHIIPKSLGGSEELSNFQTMCTDCNVEKDTQAVSYLKNRV